MDIGQIFEMTINLRFLCEKLQNPMTEEDLRSLKDSAKAKTCEILEKISEFCDNKNSESLQELFELFESIFEKLKHFNIFDEQIEFSILVLIQKAHVLQVFGKFDQLIEVLVKIEDCLSFMANLSDPNTTEFLNVPNLYFPGFKQVFGGRVVNLIFICLTLGQVYLQQTAVYSQLNQHQRALSTAEKGTELIYRLVERVCQIFDYLRKFGVGQNELADNFNGQIADFANYFDYLGSTRAIFMDVKDLNKKSDAFWRMSNDQNIKQLVARIQKDKTNQSNLTKRFQIEDNNTFHISNLVKIQTFYDTIKILEPAKFDDKLLHRMVLVLSCLIFSIATENRFISFIEIQDDMSPRNAVVPDSVKNKVENVSKESKLHSNRRFIQSEKIHLLSIEILTFAYSDSIKIIAHFFQSYKKNYSMEIFVIEEEDEQSFSTIKTGLNKFDDGRFSEVNSIPNGNPKYLRISLKHDYFNDFKRKQNDSSSEIISTNSNSLVSLKDAKQKSKSKETEFAIKTKSSVSISNGNGMKDNDSMVLQVNSIDRIKTQWGSDTQKKLFSKPPPEANFKKQKAENYMNQLNKQKTDMIVQMKSIKRDSKISNEVNPTPVKPLEKVSHPKVIKSLCNNLIKRDYIMRSKSKDYTTSVELGRSKVLTQPTMMEIKLSNRKFEIAQKRNIDRLGGMLNKFSNIILENQKYFKSKYGDKIKEKVNVKQHQSVIFRTNF